ncbi:hypothetical protein WJX72_012214 [[Myrmecia] bisecta]|uniref:Uncharacterized protein n=1 Tax=[Myrmecia] bisecta TaxID=41462 RepID=A0AAW1PMD1_9CHLO
MLHSDDELDDEELALLQAEVQALQAVLAPSYEAVHTPDGDSDSAPLEPAQPPSSQATAAKDEYDAGENVDDGDFEEISTDAWAADGPGEEAASSEPAIKAVHLKALRQAIASALGTDTASGLRALDAGVPETREHLQATREAYLAQQRQQPPLQDGQQRQQNIKDALAANRAIQARLQETLQALDGHLARVEDTQRQVYRFLDTERRGSYTGMHSLQNVPGIEGKVGSTDPGVSRFWLAARSAPAVNEDTQRLRQVYQVLPHRFTIRPWGEKEVKKLQDAVLSAVQEKKFSQVMGDLQQRTAAGQQHSLADVRRLNEEIASLTLQSPGVEATAGALTPQDWERLAQVAFDSERSAADCRTHWLNGCRPSLRLTEDWEAAEDGKLAALVEEHQRCNWLKIAEELGTGRTAAACLARYQCVLSRGGGHNRALVQGSWTAEEDARLRAAVLKHGERDWRAVAFEVGGRSVAQVLHRWRDCIGQQSLRKGRWLAEEDKQLVKAVEACGRKWSEVAKLVPNRTDVQCRDRYVNVLDPALVRSRWSAEEDETLLGAVEELRRPDGSVKWSAVAQRLPGRTDNNCTWRYQRLVKHCPGAPGRKRPVRGRQHATARGRGRGRKREWQSSSESEESAAESSDFDESANEYSDDSANESDDEASPPPKRCRAAQSSLRLGSTDAERQSPSQQSGERWSTALLSLQIRAGLSSR